MRFSYCLGGYSFKQLCKHDVLSQDMYIEISRLIYDTDPYIYPALFYDGINPPDANAVTILPAVIKSGKDEMFNKESLYLMLDGNNTIGLILWHKGNLDWKSSLLREYAKCNGVKLCPSNINAVESEYINSEYNEQGESSDNLNLINVCISNNMRNRGLGTLLLQSFISNHRESTMSLCVLADNLSAISLYQSCGFRIVREEAGFSLDQQKPIRYYMERA